MFRLSVDRLCIGVLLLAASLLPFSAAAEVLDGELGRWLGEQVAPKLIRHVGQHPRFAGVTLEVVALANQRPTTTSNELVGAIADYLQHRLLEQSQARIAWAGTNASCARMPTATLLLGIEVSGSGNRYKVSIRGLDPQEAVWIPGVSFRWQGTLAVDQRRALRRQIALGPQGTASRPFALADRAAIADEFVRQLNCLPGFALDGRVAFASAADAGRDAVPANLRKVLQTRMRKVPMLAVAADPTEADWLLHLEVQADSPSAEELVLVASSGGARQRLASIFVTRDMPREDATAVADTEAAGVARTPPPAASVAIDSLPLLSELSRLPDEDCPRTTNPSTDEYCAAVDLTLHGEGYLFSFRTEDGRVIQNQCGRSAEHSAPGRRRFRLLLDRDTTVTFYALATRDARTAAALGRFFNERSSGCGSTRQFDSQRWLTRLERVIGNAEAVDWQALELPVAAAGLLATRTGD